MNLSLLLIAVMILVVLPALIRQLFPKRNENQNKEAVYLAPDIKSEKNTHLENINIDNMEKSEKSEKSETLSDIISASAVLLSPQNQMNKTQDYFNTHITNTHTAKIIQNELFFENIITIKSPSGQFFMGYALLQSLQNTGFKYGERGLFYYSDDQDKIIFSIAPSIEPYVFNLAEIGIFKTPGLILKIIELADETMAQKVAEILAEELGGEVEY